MIRFNLALFTIGIGSSNLIKRFDKNIDIGGKTKCGRLVKYFSSILRYSYEGSSKTTKSSFKFHIGPEICYQRLLKIVFKTVFSGSTYEFCKTYKL